MTLLFLTAVMVSVLTVVHTRRGAGEAIYCGGYEWVVDMDLEKFFDRVNHDILMGKLAGRVGDKRVLRVIRRYLQAGMMGNGVVQERWKGPRRGTFISVAQQYSSG